MKPILTRSSMTERVYIVTRYTRKVSPKGVPYIVAQQKYEVSDEELEAIGLKKMELPGADVEDGAGT